MYPSVCEKLQNSKRSGKKDECTTWPFQILMLLFKMYSEIRLNSLLPSVIILPRFRVDFLSFAFCNYLASIPYLCSVFCILRLSCLDSVLAFCLLPSVIILPRFHAYFLGFGSVYQVAIAIYSMSKLAGYMLKF